MRIDYKTRLELDSVTWLKSFSAATGRPQTDIVNEALQQYRDSLAPMPAAEEPKVLASYGAQGDQAAFTPPVPPKDAPDAPPEPQAHSHGLVDPLSLAGIDEPETREQTIARLTRERDSVHTRLKRMSSKDRRDEFDRLDAEIRTLTARQISDDLEG